MREAVGEQTLSCTNDFREVGVSGRSEEITTLVKKYFSKRTGIM